MLQGSCAVIGIQSEAVSHKEATDLTETNETWHVYRFTDLGWEQACHPNSIAAYDLPLSETGNLLELVANCSTYDDAFDVWKSYLPEERRRLHLRS